MILYMTALAFRLICLSSDLAAVMSLALLCTVAAAVLGVPVRLYLFTALAFDYPDLGVKFRLLFPMLLLLDVAWAATPLLFLRQLQGLVLLCAAGLGFLPFSQRTLLYSAYANAGGHSSGIQAPRSNRLG